MEIEINVAHVLIDKNTSNFQHFIFPLQIVITQEERCVNFEQWQFVKEKNGVIAVNYLHFFN